MAAPPGLPLVLASASPRRRALLAGAGIRCEVRPSRHPEHRVPGETPGALATRLAREKAEAVARSLDGGPRRWVLGADTLVVIGGEVVGKPADADDAVAILSRLLGRDHRVLTGVALLDSATGSARQALVESRVRLRPAPREEVVAYVATGEPLDKAGAYAVQGEGRRFVIGVEGSESNVIGLPLEETLQLLRDAGLAGAP